MNPLDWQQILLECKTSIQAAIQPCLKTIREPQPNLGMGAGGDLMKPVDLAAENAIAETLQKHGVSFTLVSEESGIKEYGNTPKSCYICADPIDGTTNLIRGLPFYCSSIAVSSTPNLEGVYAGTVIDLVHNEIFYAFKGKGAYRDGQRIYTSKTQSLDEAVVGMDLNAYKAILNMTIAANVIENSKHTRHFGANALEVSHVAAGLTDAFIDLRNKIRTTDVAAGFLIAKEAGATVTDANNNPINVPLDPRQRLNFVCSANREIHKQILSLIKS
ncbi:MAG TPA: inositol monophosphatase family protein [Candidatus Acidoferrales bacterium]|nr:inositol monophosphatase family protein [Candidatus Acidoferrales bacterium]